MPELGLEVFPAMMLAAVVWDCRSWGCCRVLALAVMYFQGRLQDSGGG